MESPGSLYAGQTQQFELLDSYPTGTFTSVGEGTFQSLPNEGTQEFRQETRHQDHGQKTNELIGDYQSLLGDMRTQINQIKGKFSMPSSQSSLISNNPNQRMSGNYEQRPPVHQGRASKQDQDACFNQQRQYAENSHHTPLVNGDGAYSVRVSRDHNPYCSTEGQNNILFQSQEHPSDVQKQFIPSTTISPQQDMRQLRRCTEQPLAERNDILNQRRILSSANQRHSLTNQDQVISNSSQFKFTNSSCASPNSNRQSNFNIMNKENINSASSPQTPISKRCKQDQDQQYHEQVKLNKQLIDQVKALKSKLQTQPQQCQQDSEVRVIKLLQNEEYLQEKCQRLEVENQDLSHQLALLNGQIEGSMRNNQDLESYLENCEVSAQQFTDKQKSLFKKIGELSKRNVELKDQNQELDTKVKSLEQDKAKLSEKWIRLSARLKVEDKNRMKTKDYEKKYEQLSKGNEVMKQKIEVIERESSYLKEQNDSYKQKIQLQQKVVKEVQSRLEEIEHEKSLADQVTSKLLQRIQRYENQIQELNSDNKALQQQSQQFQQNTLHLEKSDFEIEQLSQVVQQNLQQIAQLQSENQELDQDNQRLTAELSSSLQQNTYKDQQIESLQLQVEHQTETCSEIQQQFQGLEDQLDKQKSMLQIQFSTRELQEAASYLMGQLALNERDQLIGDMPSEENLEDQAIGSLIIKSAQQIKFLNKYMDGLKAESEETSEKYDKLALKYRDMSKSYGQIRNLCDVTQAQKESSEQEAADMKIYISELENIIKNGGGISSQTQKLFSQGDQDVRSSHWLQQNYNTRGSLQHQNPQKQFLETFQPLAGANDGSNQYVKSYQTLQAESSTHVSDDINPSLYQSVDDHPVRQGDRVYALPQQQQSLNQSIKFLDRIATCRGSVQDLQPKLSQHQQSYDHSRICLPTRLIKSSSNKAKTKESSVHSTQMNTSTDKSEISLQDQIRHQISHHRQQQPKGNSNIKVLRSSSKVPIPQKQNSSQTIKNTGGNFWSQRSNSNVDLQSVRKSQQPLPHSGIAHIGSHLSQRNGSLKDLHRKFI